MRADEEPNHDLYHELAPMIGLEVTEPPKGGANDGTDAGTEKNDYHTGVRGYVTEVMGRIYHTDEFGSESARCTKCQWT